MVSVTFYTPSSATVPTPYARSQGGVTTTVGGFPATAQVQDDVACTSLGSPVTFYYQVNVWVPAGVQLNFCVNGPDIERQEAVAATIATTARLRPDPRTHAQPVLLFGQNVTTGGFAKPSQVPYCTANETKPSVSAHVSQSRGRTTIEVATTFSATGNKPCGLGELSTCGFYGDFAITGPSGHVLWTWEPMTVGRQCSPGVDLLPVTITVPSWSVLTTLLRRGTYTVRMVSIVNGTISGPTLASTSFQVN